MSTFAIIATDTHPNYSFVAPISALLWREIVGFEPITYLIGNETEWCEGTRAGVSARQLDAWHLRRMFVSSTGGYRTSTVAQVSRIFAAAEPFNPDDVLVTTDSDMWPLSRAWFSQLAQDRLTLFYANAYVGGRFPMCYIAAKASIWREVLGIGVSGISEATSLHLRENLSAQADGETSWHHDETFLGGRICRWSGYPSRCHMISRFGYPVEDRIDRVAWMENVTIVGKVDAHLCRPTYGRMQWTTRSRPLLTQLLSEERMREVDSYVNTYTAIG